MIKKNIYNGVPFFFTWLIQFKFQVFTYDRFSTAIIIRIAFGHQILSDDDPYLKMAETISYALSNSGPPGSTPVDFFPFRTYVHGR